MPATGRPAAYTPEEDKILLGTVGEGAEETNRRLREAGFAERTAAAIKQRRHHLRTKAGAVGLAEVDTLSKLMTVRRQLTEELDQLVDRRRAIEDQIRQLSQRIHEVLDDLKSEVTDVEAGTA